MRVCIISCWYNHTVYGYYTRNLRSALEKELNTSVDVISSNCTCAHGHGKDALLPGQCSYVKTRFIDEYPSKSPLKQKAKDNVRRTLESWRGMQFSKITKDYDVVHFQQVLRAFGYLSLKSFLQRSGTFKRVVTVHEFDQIQKEKPELNRIYNLADVVIVHSDFMRQKLIQTGVDEMKLTVVKYGAPFVPLNGTERVNPLFYGGHHLLKNKGFDDLIDALQILKKNEKFVRVRIFGNFLRREMDEAIIKAKAKGVAKNLIWEERLGKLKEQDIINMYQASPFTIIPYTSGSACYPVTYAMANGSAVLATNSIGIPEYVDGCGILIEPHSPSQLANSMAQLLDDPDQTAKIGRLGRERAIQIFSWEKIAQMTHRVYEHVVEK